MVRHLGDDVAEVVTPHLAACRAAVAALAPRNWTASIDDSGRALAQLTEDLRAVDPAIADRQERVAMVDLSELAVSQSVVALDDPRPDGIVREASFAQLVDMCVPVRPAVAPVAAFDARASAWVIRGGDAQISVIGRYNSPVADLGAENQIFGFVVRAAPSRLSVRRTDGRLVLVDGHHRALALWRAGVREVPALVADGLDVDDVTTGLFDEATVMSTAAPRLADYLVDDVSVDCFVARSRRAIIVSSAELEVPD